jgi:hypothetical protein
MEANKWLKQFFLLLAVLITFAPTTFGEVYLDGSNHLGKLQGNKPTLPVYRKTITSWGAPVSIEIFRKDALFPHIDKTPGLKRIDKRTKDGRLIRITYDENKEHLLFQ